MKTFSLLIATLFITATAYAGIQGYAGTTDLKLFNKIKCSTGITCTREADKLLMVSSPTASAGAFTITGAASTDGILNIETNAAAANADKWKMTADHSTDSLILYNKTSGSYVSKLTLTTAGALSTSGGVAVSSGLFKNYSHKWKPVALTDGTNTTPSATVLYLTQIYIEANVSITGIKVLNGDTAGTNKYIVALFDSAGTNLANSDLAGATTSGTAAYQSVAFTAPYAAVGPGVYWIGLYVNGTTDRFHSIPAAGEIGGYAGSVTGQTFGTVTVITPPTTFTADKGPVAFTY